MRLAALLIAAILLTSCKSAPVKARKIMAPVAKKAAQAGRLVEKQRGSIGRLKVSAMEAQRIAEKIHETRPDGDTAELILAQRTAGKEITALTGSNEELRLTISDLEGEVAKAQDKVAVQIAEAETWRAWAWFWGKAFFGLLGAWIALRIFKAYLLTVPIVGPIISRIL